MCDNRTKKQAEAIGDTLEMVQALNNIGTDYRRMGVLEMAQDYHYRAYAICKASTDSSFTARKNRVVALNGLGNIYLTLGNYARADSALRLALAGERELNSPLGQAINYANIGSIFRQRGLTDSAFAYFRKSMGLNLQINNQLGISLCHIYFGELYEKNNNYSKAINEYETALTPMQAMKDEWHAINPLIALAGIYVKTGNYSKALHYLDTARGIAQNIKSTEHKAEIYSLYYKLYKRMGDTRAALEWHEKAADMHDSMQPTGQRHERGATQPEERTGDTLCLCHHIQHSSDHTVRRNRHVHIHTTYSLTQPSGAEETRRHARDFLHQHHTRIPNTAHHYTRTEPSAAQEQE